jgi:hypothetical protein
LKLQILQVYLLLNIQVHTLSRSEISRNKQINTPYD